MEEEASPGDEIKDVIMATEVVTNRDTIIKTMEATEEDNVEENLTNHPLRGTPGSIPRPKMLTRTAVGIAMKLVIGKGSVFKRRKMKPRVRNLNPMVHFFGLSDALPEFYGQAALSMGNPAIGEMYQGITEILEDGVFKEFPNSMEYLN